jgi:hypothetical protein
MANVANKYQNSKIYKLKCITPDISEEEYVGHTTQRYLSTRMAKHRNCAKNMENIERKVYAAMNNTGIHNWQICLLENYPCTSSDEIKAREQYWIDLLHPSLNTIGAIFDVIKNKEHKLAYMKEYEARPERKEEKRKRYMSIIQCQCGRQYTKDHKKRHEQSKLHTAGLENQFNNEFQMLANIDMSD